MTFTPRTVVYIIIAALTGVALGLTFGVDWSPEPKRTMLSRDNPRVEVTVAPGTPVQALIDLVYNPEYKPENGSWSIFVLSLRPDKYTVPLNENHDDEPVYVIGEPTDGKHRWIPGARSGTYDVPKLVNSWAYLATLTASSEEESVVVLFAFVPNGGKRAPAVRYLKLVVHTRS